jgi:PAS domain S-box-containing protein
LKPFSPLWWPAGVGLVSLALTGWVWNHERQTQDRNLRANFDFGLRQTGTRIEARLASYEQMLRGLRGLFDASDEVTAKDFAQYVGALTAGPDFAGLRALAYARLVFTGPVPPQAPLRFLAPAGSQGLSALDGDLLANPSLNAVLVQARDSGGMVLSAPLKTAGPVPAASEDATAGPLFLLVLPLYREDQRLNSAEARRQQLAGWVLAAFRVGDLMSSLYGEDLPGLDVRVHDGPDPTEATRIYSSAQGSVPRRAPRLQAREFVGVGGHTWTLDVRSSPAFESRYLGDSAQVIAVAGTGLSVLAVLLTWLLVTARERAHESARRMTRELRDSTERYRRIVDTANEGILLVDVTGRINFANPKMQALLGSPAQALQGRDWLSCLDDAGQRAWQTDMLPRLRAGEPDLRDLRLQRADGGPLWATVSMSPIVGEDGHYAGALAMVTDINARRLAEEQQALLEAQLLQSQKMEAIGTLAGGIAHDFNNITAAILGNLALGREALTPAQAALGRLDQVQLAAERGRSLVQQIAAFSRRQAPERVRQPLKALLEEAVRLLRTTLPARVQLRWQSADDSLLVHADATQLQQVLMNLCTNAWHALHGGAGHVDISLEAVLLDAAEATRWALPGGGRYARVRVRDDGCGMDDATRARIFEPFFTTKPVGQGTGLGLSVVHGIVLAHGGAIRVESAPGQGSTFDILLPLADATGDALSASARAQPPVATPRGRGQHVLYVDDDPVVLAMVDGLLLHLGYRVTSLSDARQALVRALDAADPVDVVVTDYNMPDLSGVALAAALHVQRPDLPVLLTSGYVSDTLRADAEQAGVRQVMQKEYTLEQLGALLHGVLNPDAAPPAGAETP